MEIINQALTTLKDLPRSIQALIVVAVLAGFLTFSYFQFNAPEEVVTPTTSTVDKKLEVGQINSKGNIEGGINFSQ